MATSLTGVGILWATLSLAAALLCCSGFYLPFWIQVPLANNLSGIELEKSEIIELPRLEHGLFTSVLDLDYVENSDDSVKDAVHRYESEEMPDENFVEPAKVESNEATDKHVEVVSKGRPKKGRKIKYTEKDRKTRQKKTNRNKNIILPKGNLWIQNHS